VRGAGEADEVEEEELRKLHAEKRGISPRNELQSQVKEVEKAPIPPKTLECPLG